MGCRRCRQGTCSNKHMEAERGRIHPGCREWEGRRERRSQRHLMDSLFSSLINRSTYWKVR